MKDTSRNTLIVVQDPDHPLLLSDAFDVDDVHWQDAASDLRCGVKTRYRQADLACRVRIGDGARRGTAQVLLDAPARAVTPGQYAVFYRGEVCLGGGVIARRSNSRLPRAGAPEGRSATGVARAGAAP